MHRLHPATAMAGWNHSTRLEVVRHSALLPRKGSPLPHVLLGRIPEEAKFVLLGEASHGTGGHSTRLPCAATPHKRACTSLASTGRHTASLRCCNAATPRHSRNCRQRSFTPCAPS